MPLSTPPITLPPGDLITDDYQYEYNGLLLGHGTSYIMEKVSGILSHPATVENHQKRQDRHGLAYGYEVWDARRIAFDVAIEAATGATVETLLDLFHDKFEIPALYISRVISASTQVDIPFIMKRPNKPKRVCYGHTSKLDFDSTGDVAGGLARGSVELLCGDPRVYSLDFGTLASNIAGGASSSPTLLVPAIGNFSSPRVTLTFTGPATNPFITNVSLGRAIRLNGILSPADTVVIDLFKRTIMLNGVNAYWMRRADNQWWELGGGGTNHIVFSRQSSDAVNAPVQINWQDCWSTA